MDRVYTVLSLKDVRQGARLRSLLRIWHARSLRGPLALEN